MAGAYHDPFNAAAEKSEAVVKGWLIEGAAKPAKPAQILSASCQWICTFATQSETWDTDGGNDHGSGENSCYDARHDRTPNQEYSGR